jgi:hypothetical protein
MKLSNASKSFVKAALNGHTSALVYAFDFASSPQGSKFWCNQIINEELTPEGRAALEAMLND